MSEVLRVTDLHVTFRTGQGMLRAVRGVSLRLSEGETLALVGESGCGKSVTARSLLRLEDGPAVCMAAEELCVGGRDVLAATQRELLAIRGELAGMVFQDPMTYLDPTMRVGPQITEGLLRRGRLTRTQCRQAAVRALEQVQISDAPLRARQYPHQLSGGMRQRVMIAMALACAPRLLIADEPTTALDPTIQLQVLTLLRRIQREQGTAILLITHDLSVVAHTAHRVAVMYAGGIVEEGPVERLFSAPAHPYTRGLLCSLPTGAVDQDLSVIEGAPPDLSALPPGCAFAPRCGDCMEICIQREPERRQVAPGQFAACWLLHPDRPRDRR